MGRAGSPLLLAAVWGVGAAKVLAGLLALALVMPWVRAFPRWMLLAAGWGGAVLLTLYGGVLVAVEALVVGGLISPSGPVDWFALKWHLFLWDPWFLLWGVFLGAAAGTTPATGVVAGEPGSTGPEERGRQVGSPTRVSGRYKPASKRLTTRARTPCASGSGRSPTAASAPMAPSSARPTRESQPRHARNVSENQVHGYCAPPRRKVEPHEKDHAQRPDPAPQPTGPCPLARRHEDTNRGLPVGSPIRVLYTAWSGKRRSVRARQQGAKGPLRLGNLARPSANRQVEDRLCQGRHARAHDQGDAHPLHDLCLDEDQAQNGGQQAG